MNNIAERAGVSRTTVSVILNERHDAVGIAEETRLKVLAVAEELGYQRNKLALAVKTGQSRTIGFLARTVLLEYTSRCFFGMLNTADDLGYSLQHIRLSGPAERKDLVRCVEHRLAGVVVYAPYEDFPFEIMRHEFEKNNLPVVLLDFKACPDWAIGVTSDDEMGAHQAVQHLVELGHKRIVFVGGKENHGTAVMRVQGYQNAMQASGLGDFVRMEWTNWSEEALEKLLPELMAEKEPPTAILCGSDPMALLALRVLRAAGKQVPHDVSVVGFSDLLRTDLADPPLSTVAVPYEEMGQAAVHLLLKGLSTHGTEPSPQPLSRQEGQRYYLPTRLTLRGTTAPPHRG